MQHCWIQTNWCQFLHPKCFRCCAIIVITLILSFRCRQTFASVEFSSILCIKSNWSPYNYCKKKATINKGIYEFMLNGNKLKIGSSIMHPKCDIVAASISFLLLLNLGSVFCVKIEIMFYEFYSKVITMNYGSTV